MARMRTFIAVELPPRVKARAAELIKQLRAAAADVNWVHPEQMHLTLKFLGDVPDTEVPDICRVVREVAARFEPFEVICRGAGAFPDIQRPRTVWIGITDGGEELRRLQAALDEDLQAKLGIAREHRGFHPHLTIGRVKRESSGGEGVLGGLLAQQAQFDADLAVVDELVTFASFLARRGPTHEALDHAELGGK
jgi:RNA 2',3'-cyclic 3'-phosphodiesterase